MLRVEHLSVRHGSVLAVQELSCVVESGRCLALLGPSGAGKTTALMAIAGLLPANGQVFIREQAVQDLPPERRDAVYLFQEPLLFPFLNVEGNVTFGLELRGIPARERKERAASMLERVQLAGFERRAPERLSGGQQQRVAIARALVTSPAVLLLDEPFSSLDVALRAEMAKLLCELRSELGFATVLVTHDPSEAIRLADDVCVMVGARIVTRGPARKILAHPQGPDEALLAILRDSHMRELE